MLNAAGFYTEPTPENVAVSLLKARINTNESNPSTYLTQDLSGVYNDTDPRSYQLSSYSYLILPTRVSGQFNEAKGLTLGAFAYYAMCQAQQQSASLGYSPMPVNLVEASFEQIRKIPGVQVQDIDITQCKNPTFSADGSNVLANSAPQPQACDRLGPGQCPNGTGGLSNVPTAVVAAAATPVPPGGAAGTPPAAGGTPAPGAAVTPVPGTPVSGAAGVPVAAGGAGVPAAAGGAGVPAAGGGASAPTGATANTILDASGVAVDALTGAPIDPTSLGGADGVLSGACDPDTGVCVGSAGPVPLAGAATSAAIGPITATTLPKGSGWNATLALVLLIVVLTIGVVLVPALALRHFTRGTTT